MAEHLVLSRFQLLRSAKARNQFYCPGALKKAEYKNREFTLHPGDCLFVYTDGIPEAINEFNEFFGEERLIEALNEGETSAPEEIIRHVHDAVNRFTDHTPQFDDITMFCCRYNGPNNPL
ncbi:MAG: serine/threonine-protein phosphatase [Oscillospiraceae bacterium]|nr:serine/threonine-protein phosphatase [Oscillospiraceae bacterium]